LCVFPHKKKRDPEFVRPLGSHRGESPAPGMVSGGENQRGRVKEMGT